MKYHYTVAGDMQHAPAGQNNIMVMRLPIVVISAILRSTIITLGVQ